MNNNSPSMTTVVVGTLAFLGVAYVGYSFIYVPYRTNNLKIVGMTLENDAKDKAKRDLRLEQKRLSEKWDKLSLPKTIEMAASDYGEKLKPLLSKAGLTVDDFKVTLPPETRAAGQMKKTAQHQILTFNVRAKGTLKALTKATEQLRQVPVMDRVKQVVIDRADPKDKTGKLNIQMTIEAMIVAGTDNHPTWKASAANNPLRETLSDRNLSDLPLRDPFLGKVPPPPPPPKQEVVEERKPTGPDPRLFIRVDTILPNLQEASLFDLSRNKASRLRAKLGYDIFRISDEETGAPVMKGKVLRIDPRDVYFQVGDNVFAMHIGETVAEAMKKPMDHAEVEELELTSLIDPEFAKETKGTGTFTGTGSPSKGSKKGSSKGPSRSKGL
jgi:hypothetical protein